MSQFQFEATENLTLAFEPFIDLTATPPSYIESGDTITCTYKAPDSSTGTVSMSRDATTKIWTGSVLVASYQQGVWLFRAVSNDASNPNPQYRACYWGVGALADIPAIKAKTDNLPAAPASTGDVTTVGTAVAAVGTAVTDVGNAVDDVYSRLGAPAGASIAADIAEIGGVDGRDLTEIYDAVTAGNVDLSPVLTAVEVVRAMVGNDWVLDSVNNKILVYDNSGYQNGAGTVLFAWDTFDSSGNATTARIFRRLVGSPP